jgi:hypothetical protein
LLDYVYVQQHSLLLLLLFPAAVADQAPQLPQLTCHSACLLCDRNTYRCCQAGA